MYKQTICVRWHAKHSLVRVPVDSIAVAARQIAPAAIAPAPGFVTKSGLLAPLKAPSIAFAHAFDPIGLHSPTFVDIDNENS